MDKTRKELARQIGKQMESARLEANLSRKELGEKLGLSERGYGHLEAGRNLIGLEYLLQLPFIFNKPITSFLPDYIVTDSERNNALLDPRLRAIADHWTEIAADEAGETFLALVYELFAVYLTKGRSKEIPPK